MKKSISTLDYIINISARKLEYFEYVKSNYPAFEEHQDALKNIIANMNNSVFLTSYEKKNKRFQDLEKTLKLDKSEIRDNFIRTFKDIEYELYMEFFPPISKI